MSTSTPEAMINEGGAIQQPSIPQKAAWNERLEATCRQANRQFHENCQTHPYLSLFLALSIGVLAGTALPIRSHRR